MNCRHTFRVFAPLADVAGFHTSAPSLKAITPPVIPMQLDHAPQRMGDRDEIGFTMWLGPLPVRWEARGEDVSPTGFPGLGLGGRLSADQPFPDLGAAPGARTVAGG